MSLSPSKRQGEDFIVVLIDIGLQVGLAMYVISLRIFPHNATAVTQADHYHG